MPFHCPIGEIKEFFYNSETLNILNSDDEEVAARLSCDPVVGTCLAYCVDKETQLPNNKVFWSGSEEIAWGVD